MVRGVVRKDCPQGQVPPPSRGRWQTCTPNTPVTQGPRTIVDHHETHHEIGHQFDHETGQYLPKTGGRHVVPTLTFVVTFVVTFVLTFIVTVVVSCVVIRVVSAV